MKKTRGWWCTAVEGGWASQQTRDAFSSSLPGSFELPNQGQAQARLETVCSPPPVVPSSGGAGGSWTARVGLVSGARGMASSWCSAEGRAGRFALWMSCSS